VWVVLLADAVEALEDHDQVLVEDSVDEDQVDVGGLEDVVDELQADDW
jgi:hypothetical protein